jgi:hypothetical protein
MAISRKMEREALKAKYLDAITKLFSESEDVLRVKSNEIAFPITDSEGNEDFIVITVKIPTGSNKGLEPCDGYAMAEEYEMRRPVKFSISGIKKNFCKNVACAERDSARRIFRIF